MANRPCHGRPGLLRRHRRPAPRPHRYPRPRPPARPGQPPPPDPGMIPLTVPEVAADVRSRSATGNALMCSADTFST